MAVRETILEAVKSKVATITVANGYLTDIASVEYGLKDWEEARPNQAGDWAGIVPIRESVATKVGETHNDLTVAVLAHIGCARTSAGVITAWSNFLTDLETAFYNDATLGGTSGLHRVAITGVESSVGSPDSAREGIVTVAATLSVKFEVDA